MHEYSIVQSLLDSCEDNAKQNNATKITKVVVKIGVMSGVEPDLLQSAFDTFKEGTMCEGCEFIINIQPIVIKCHKCNSESTLDKHEYTCPQCQSIELDVIDGEDMYLMQLELGDE
jgi:hydrogenase nickel incorporation protein HypA/HybF